MRTLFTPAALAALCLAGGAAAQQGPAPAAPRGLLNGTVTVGTGTVLVAGGTRLVTPYSVNAAPGTTLDAADGGFVFTGDVDQLFGTDAATQVVRDFVLAKPSGAVVLQTDLAVTGVLRAGGGTLDADGHTARLVATVDGGAVTRLAALDGDGSALGTPLVYERPYVDGEGWRMIAAPFAAQPFTTLNDDFHTQGATGADTPDGTPNLYWWDGALPAGSRYVGVTDYTQAFASGRGYFFYAYGTDPGTGSPNLPGTWDVEGAEPAGAVTAELSYSSTDGERRWNLLGNPYAAPLDWHAVQTAGQFQAAYGIWDPAANGGVGNYAYYSAAGTASGRAGRYVPAFEGFWAEASLQSPFGLTFSRDWKAPGGAPVYVGRGGAVPELRFHLEGEGLESTDPVALFLDGGAAGEDALDATWLRPLSTDHAALFFVREGDARRLVFDARPAAADGQTLGLAVETSRGGFYLLSWPGLDAAPEGLITLADTETGAVVDLRTEGVYAFEAGASAPSLTPGGPPELASRPTAPRFVVRFGAVTAGEGPSPVAALELAAPAPNPVRSRATVRYALPAGGAVRVAVYDALGREVAVLAEGERAAGRHEARLDASGLAAGVYVVRVEAGGDARTQRLTVAH